MAVRWSLVVVLVAGACSLTPRPPPAPPRTSTLGLEISTSTLANGLRVVVVRDPAASEVQVTMRYEVGAVDDGPRAGLAHLVEHLMFQQELDGQALFARLEDTATYFNAHTSLDATTYVARGPRTQLEALLAIEAARAELRCATLDDAVFVREREVVLNEIKQRDQTSEVFAAIHHELYPEGHPYRQEVGGSVASVGAITREEACRFADVHYAPNNAVLVVSGDVAPADVEVVLARGLARLPRREVSARVAVTAVAPPPHHVEVPAPIASDVFVLAWPLPLDPTLQAKVRAIAAAVPRLAAAKIKGTAATVDFGDRRAPMLGIAVVPGEGETFADAIRGTRAAIESLPAVFRDGETPWVEEVMFDRLKHGALFELYASLDEGGDRDARLAGFVAAGVDPSAALAAELAALRTLTRAEGLRLARTFLPADGPTGITLRAAALASRGGFTQLRAPLHHLGARRSAETTRETTGVSTHVLPNGLQVVLAPTSSVPTLEARLVFRTGSADEPQPQRGVALLAAHTLTWDLHHLEDLMLFARAGGVRDTDVTRDRTTFAVHGLDTSLDVVLAGLRRWVLDGTYDDTAAGFVRALRQAARHVDDEGLLTDAWRAALYGPAHPYVHGGIPRHASHDVTQRDAAAFRAAHYVPGNATLVLAGRFDPMLAEQWIAYLFSSWTGSSPPRRAPDARPAAASIAQVDDVAMVQLRIALPADHGTRAVRLVAAAMLDGIARDVRFGLGASYTFDAQLDEARLADVYVLGGWIDAARAPEAVRLVRDRLAELRATHEVAARAFELARGRVLAQLRSQLGGASSIADRVERDVELGRAPMADAETARDVEALALDDLAATLASLEPARATVLMRGPAEALAASFAVLGRTPAYVAPPSGPLDEAPGATAPTFAVTEQRVRMSEVATSLTQQPGPLIAVMVSLGHRWTRDRTGYLLGGGIGYRPWSNFALGAGLEVAYGSASSVDVVATAQYEVNRRVWAQLAAGYRADVRGNDLLVGGQLGWDFAQEGDHRFGLAARWHRVGRADGGFSLALTYRQ